MRYWLKNFIALLAALLVGGASNARALSVVWRTSGSSPTTLGSCAYTLGPTGNRTALVENFSGGNHTYNWAYDYLYRMTGETFSGTGFTGSPAVTYGFDAVGNRTNRTSSVLGIGSQAPTYTTNDWLASDTYDANGNTIVSGITNYQYDVLGHLTNVNNGQILITYDGDGNRVSKTVNGTTTWYLVDDRNPSGYAQVLEEYQGSSLSRVYNYGFALISQRQVASGTISYYGTDGHGSTRFLMDVNGNITDTYTFDAYGLMIASSGTTPNNYLDCGQQWDSDLGFYYLRARYYKPDTGRFWTMDTYEGNNEDPLSLHKYLYCKADPIMGIDPSGHDGDLGSLMMSTSIGASLDSMYNGAVIAAGNSMQATINGVQANMSGEQILTSYLVDTAIGVGVGVAIGLAAELCGEMLYGGGAAANACFVAGTPVATEFGEKPIEQITAGDLVWSRDELIGEFQLEKVVRTHVRLVGSEVMVQTADETFTATLTHPFRVKNKGWVHAGNLLLGDQFISLNGDTETVTETTTTNATALVYNFEVENTHTYFVGEHPVLVHNACAWATRKASLPEEPGIYIIRTTSGERYVGQAKDLYSRLTSSRHRFSALIQDPNNELFTMSLDASKVKGSVGDALDAAEDFYIKALGAKRTSANRMGLNSRVQRNSDWMNNYFQQDGFPPIGDPVAH